MEEPRKNFQTTLQIVILDFKNNNQYDVLELHQKGITKAHTITNKVFSIPVEVKSFKEKIEVIFKSSLSVKPDTKYNVIMFKNHSNFLYAFLNSKEDYQIDFYVQYSPNNKYSSLYGPIKIKENNKEYMFYPNLIDVIRMKAFFTICNISINFLFIIPKVNFKVYKKDLHGENVLKLCLYYLYKVKEREKISHCLQCHSYYHKRTPSEELLDKLNNNQNFVDTCYKEVQRITLSFETLICSYSKKAPDLNELLRTFYPQFSGLLSKFPNLLDISLLPINQITCLKKKMFHLLSYCYLIELFYSISGNWENLLSDNNILPKRNENKIIYLYTKIIECWDIVNEEIEQLSNTDNNWRDKCRRISVITNSLFPQIDNQDSHLYIPKELIIHKLNEKNFYRKAYDLLINLIFQLKEKSFLIEPLTLLNSNISENINREQGYIEEPPRDEYDRVDSFEIDILDYKAIRDELLDNIPNKIYRLKTSNQFRAMYYPRSQDLAINEHVLFNNEIGNNIDKIFENNEDPQCKYSIQVFTELLHEALGHMKIGIDKVFINTPEKFVFNGEFKTFSSEQKPDAGDIIEMNISDKKEYIECLKDPFKEDCKDFYNVSLFTSETNQNLNKTFVSVFGEITNTEDEEQSTKKNMHQLRSNRFKKDFHKNILYKRQYQIFSSLNKKYHKHHMLKI